MKNTPRFLIAAAALALLASASQVRAGGSSACCSASRCNTVTAASPKTSAALGERCRSMCASGDQASARNTITPLTASAASPKVQAVLNGQSIASANATESSYAGVRAVQDGIAASPKVRSTLNERAQGVEVAPLK